MTLKPREETTHYCKGLLDTGKPIVVTNKATGKEINTDLWRREFVDNGVTWVIQMRYVPDKKIKTHDRRGYLTFNGVRVQLDIFKKVERKK